MRVVIVHNHYQQPGGEDVVVEQESQLLTRHGVIVRQYLRSNADIPNSADFALAVQTVWSRRTAREISSLIREFRPDIIHAHNTFPLISPSLYATGARHGVPIVQTLHNFRLFCLQAMFLRKGAICEDCMHVFPWRGIVRKCYRNSTAASSAVAAMIAFHRALRTYDRYIARYIAPSAFCREKLIEAGFPEEKLVTKPNFANPPPFRSPDPRNGALFVGRLSIEKGIAVLSKAAREAGIHVTVFGAGPEETMLARSGQFDLLGWADSQTMMARMQQSAYLVMPSIGYETFGLPVIEAFACSLPVIASRLGALAELVDDGRTGLLFEPGDPGDLARKLRWAETHPKEMRRMGEAAHVEYELKYSPEKNYAQLMDIYHDAARANGSARHAGAP